MMSTMKRSREEMESLANMAKCLIMLSRGSGGSRGGGHHQTHDLSALISTSRTTSTRPVSHDHRVFQCKTCSRQFPSFQALGGHRASHKKPRLVGGSDSSSSSSDHHDIADQESLAKLKPKTHECSICGLEFTIGQALGGHMRRHRGSNLISNNEAKSNINKSLLHKQHHQQQQAAAAGVLPAVLKRSNSSRRILCLDLNLSPPPENLEFDQLFTSSTTATGMVINTKKNKLQVNYEPPMVHCFI